jgi:lipopolysaccharide transport system ATP-binding protein
MSYVEGDKEVQDWVHHAALVTVLDGDFYGTGKSYPPGWKGKCVLVKYSWQRSSTPLQESGVERGQESTK